MMTHMNYKMHHILTYTGKHFNVLDPREKDVDLYDVAHALSQQCRFTGHTKFPFTVAQHCLLTSYLRGFEGAPYAVRLAGLLHDAGETYLCDIASPIKHTPEFREYRRLEDEVETVVLKALKCPGLTDLEWAAVKHAEMRVCKAEIHKVMDPDEIHWDPMWNTVPLVPNLKDSIVEETPKSVENQFIRRYYFLLGKCE